MIDSQKRGLIREEDYAAAVAARENEDKDCEAFVGTASPLVGDPDYGRLTVADPDEQAVGNVGPLHVVPQGREPPQCEVTNR